MGSPVDKAVLDALDRLAEMAGELYGNTDFAYSGSKGFLDEHRDALATVRGEIERLHRVYEDESDSSAKAWADRDSWKAQAELFRPYVARSEAAEAENQRLTEGLRKIENASISQGYERYEDDVVGAWVVDEARALLSASHSDGGGAK